MKPLHEELKIIRTEKGVSLKEISDKMKIRLDYLESIEEGDYTVTPRPFLRAFLREYAEAIEIDPIQVMSKLDKKIDSIIPEDTSTKTPEIENPQKETTETDAKSITAVVSPEPEIAKEPEIPPELEKSKESEELHGQEKSPEPDNSQESAKSEKSVKTQEPEDLQTPLESPEPEKNTETSEDKKKKPKKRKRRKKTNGKIKTSSQKRKKTKKVEEVKEIEEKTPVESEQEIIDTPDENIQTSLFKGNADPAEEPAGETNEDLPSEKENFSEKLSPPAEKVEKIKENQKTEFKQLKTIDEEPRREISRSISSLLSEGQRSSNIQFYGVIITISATIALIIYLVATGIIF